MTTVLLTGFEPFGGEPTNPSWDAVRLVVDGWTGEDEVTGALLPVEFGRAAETLAAAMDRVRPDVVIAVGQAGGRDGVSLERVAVNVADAGIPDNAGSQPIDEPLALGGPDALFSTLPIKAAVAAVMDAGLPAHVSNTAGTYVCNAVFYAARHRIAEAGTDVRAGFVHVPFSSDQPGAAAASSMPIEDIAAALRVIVETTIATGTDIRAVGGATH